MGLSGLARAVSSYSGLTEEVLRLWDAATALGAPPRGLHHGRPAGRARPGPSASPWSRCPAASSRAPRSATRGRLSRGGRLLVGAAPSLRDEVEAAAVLAESLAAEWGPAGEDSVPKTLARASAGLGSRSSPAPG